MADHDFSAWPWKLPHHKSHMNPIQSKARSILRAMRAPSGEKKILKGLFVIYLRGQRLNGPKTKNLSWSIITVELSVIYLWQVFPYLANSPEWLVRAALLFALPFLSRLSCPLPFPLGSVVSSLTHCWWTALFFHLVPWRHFPLMDLP